MNVIDYVTEEVRRQGHDVTQVDGIERVAWMLQAWAEAMLHHDTLPSIADAIVLGAMIEAVRNRDGIRSVGVRVGSRICCPPLEVRPRLERLWSSAIQDGKLVASPLEFYREFELIHPFVDGNGRTGKCLLNWLNKSLWQPIFPPQDFWGDITRNP